MLSIQDRLKSLEYPTGPVDIVLDTDAYNEIDDQFAISYALCSKEKLNLQAIYAAPFHNSRSSGPKDGMEKSYQEILKLLNLAGEKLDVYKGSAAFLENEQKPVDSDAAHDLAQRAAAYSADRPLYVVAIGAITNIASALLINPNIADNIVVIWLGGNSIDWPNSKEFNLMQDVAAARVVYGCGVPLVLLPCMGVVSSFTTTGPELEYWLKGKNALCDYLVQQTVNEANSYAAGRVWSRVIWDVTAIAWLLNDQGRLLKDRLIPTPIPEYDDHYAYDPTRPLCKYVYHISRDALFGDLFSKISM